MKGLYGSSLVVYLSKLSFYFHARGRTSTSHGVNFACATCTVCVSSYERIKHFCVFRRFLCNRVFVIGVYFTNVSSFERVVKQRINYRACDGAKDAIGRRVQSAYQRRFKFRRHVVRIEFGVCDLFMRILRRFFAWFIRAYFDMARNDEAITICEARIALPICRQVTRYPFLDRACRHGVCEEISIQIVLAGCFACSSN